MSDIGRAERLLRLRQEGFDVLVIGGGITGTAIARDAASRGYRTALVEARDFAEGTSSRSSRLIHGGLRYLEHLEFDLVFEASQERRTLLRIAPHLVHPLEFFFPIYREGRIGRRKLDAGMWLYDALSLFRNIERHQMLRPEEVLEREPGLRPEGLLGGARYFDAQVDDARLVLATALAAAETGAAVANRVEALEVATRDWPGHRTLVRDLETGEEWVVDSLAVVNATGPWAEDTLARAGVEGRDVVRPSRGSHIHVAREKVGHERALIFESKLDGRIMFVLPWRDLTLIGTTDEFDDRPADRVAPTAEDVRYLLESTNRLFARADLGPRDVRSAWAGLRPLATSGETPTEEAAVSRDFALLEEPPGVFTVSGGKLTSHRAMAEETMDEIARLLETAGVAARRDGDTAQVPLPGGDFEGFESLRDGVRERAVALGLGGASAERLARAYGTRASDLLAMVEASPELGGRVVEERPEIEAEVVYAARREMARHVEDVLYRRTHLGWEAGEAFDDACAAVARRMSEVFGWDGGREASEVMRARAVREKDEAWRHAIGP